MKIKKQFSSLESPHLLLDRRHFFYLFLLSVIIYSAVIFKVKTIVWGDSLYYYAYTRSIVIDHDVDFLNEAYREDGGFPNEPEISEITGKVINKFSPGSSILWIPGFVIGHLIGGADGYGFITQYFTAISTVMFSILGLFFINKTILLFFEKKVAFLTTIFLYLTTQMFYYTSIDPLNSHSASFMLSSLFLYLIAVFSQSRGVDKSLGGALGKFLNKTKVFSWHKMLILGFLGGAIVLVRNQDVVVLLPASIYFLIQKREGLMEALNRIVLFWGSVFLVLSTQFFITLSMYGRLGSPYLIGGEQLSWLKPNFIRVLFSFGNGLFTFAPILVVAAVGLVLSQKLTVKNWLQTLVKNRPQIKNIRLFKEMSLIATFAFILQLYVVASWGREIIGGPYGSRMFISVLPHLALGLALIFEKYKNYDKFYLIIYTGLTLLLANNLLQTTIMLIRF